MSLIRGRREVRRADPVSMEEFGYLLGRGTGSSVTTKSGVTVGPNRALGITAWYSGVRYLSETVAGLPVHAFRDMRGERRQRADPPWVREPDVEQPWFGLIEFFMMSLLHKGNAYGWKIRNDLGQVVGLREIHPDRVTTGVAPDSTKRFMIDQGGPYTTRDVFHVPGLAYDGRVGLNPIQYAADALGTIAAADDYAGRFFGQNTHVGGVISVPGPLNEVQAKAMKAEWDRFHEGLVNAHKTGVLSQSSTYTKLALNAEDAQLLETRQYGVTEVARLLRLPPHKLYDLTRATFSNIEHQSIEAITDGIQPWVERLEAWINFDPDLMASGNFLEFSLEGRLRGDTQSRYAAYTSATGGPWASVNEVRKLENLPSVEGGDDIHSPLNMEPLGQAEMAGASPAELAAMLQKLYLSVGVVVSADEARKILNDAGAGLTGPAPRKAGAA